MSRKPSPSFASRPLANLAIKSESGFDNSTATVLADDNASGFHTRLYEHYSPLSEHYMLHSFYADGSPFEDGYSYFTGLREGSVRLLSHIVVAVTSLVTLAFVVSFVSPLRCMNNGNAANASATHLAAESSIITRSLCFDTSSLQRHYLACRGDSASEITRVTTPLARGVVHYGHVWRAVGRATGVLTRKGITGDLPVDDWNRDPGAACDRVSNKGVELRENRSHGADSTVVNVVLARGGSPRAGKGSSDSRSVDGSVSMSLPVPS